MAGGPGVSGRPGRPRIGVITNPGSQRNKTGLGEMRELLDPAPNVEHVVLDKITDVPEILKSFEQREVDTLAVAGGDGTVQAVLTEIYGQRPFAAVPRLVVVPRGMTNMIAADVGLKKRGLKGLRRLVEADAAEIERASVRRRILRLENARDQPPLYGMFFGGSGVTRAIEACRRGVHPYKVEAEAAAAVTLLGLLGRWFLRRGAGTGKSDSIFYGDPIGITLDEEDRVTMESLVIVATTLDRLILGSRPFWGRDDGRLRFTAISYPPKRMLRYAWRVLYGGEDRRLPAETYRSWSVDRVALAMECPFTLDGELFEPAVGHEVVLTAADEAVFVRL